MAQHHHDTAAGRVAYALADRGLHALAAQVRDGQRPIGAVVEELLAAGCPELCDLIITELRGSRRRATA